jgi:Zn-dependent alcohol dehydrogenase
MKSKIVATGLIVVLLIIAVMQPVILGQAVGLPQFGTWDTVKTIPPGDEVEIELKSGKQVKGEMTSVSDGAIMVGRGSKSVTTTREEVKRLSRIIKKSSRKPILVGALVGAGVIGGGTAVAAAGGSNSGDDAAIFTVLMGLAGAGVGALVGTIFMKKKRSVLVYESQ